MAAAPPSPAQIAKALEKRDRRPEGRGARDVGRALEEARGAPGREHPADRLLGIGQDHAHARGRGPVGREPGARLALDRGAHPRERAGRGGRAGPPGREAAAAAARASPRAARRRGPDREAAGAGDARPRLRGRGGQDPQPGRRPAERARHPRAGGAAHADRERGGRVRAARLGGRRHGQRGLEPAPVRVRRRLRGPVRRRLLSRHGGQGPGRAQGGDRGRRGRTRAGGAAVLAPRMAQDRGPLRVRHEPAVPVALRRGRAARVALGGGASRRSSPKAPTRACGNPRLTSRPSASSWR